MIIFKKDYPNVPGSKAPKIPEHFSSEETFIWACHIRCSIYVPGLLLVLAMLLSAVAIGGRPAYFEGHYLEGKSTHDRRLAHSSGASESSLISRLSPPSHMPRPS